MATVVPNAVVDSVLSASESMERSDSLNNPTCSSVSDSGRTRGHEPRRLNYPGCAAWGLLQRAADLIPGRMACHYNSREWTWAELNREACRAAGLFRRLGVRRGDRVGILLPNVPEYVIALNGIWRAGAIAVAISPMMVADEVEKLLAATQCRVVVCLDMLAGLIAGEHRPAHTLLVSLRPELNIVEQIAYLYLRHRRTGHWLAPRDSGTLWFMEELEKSEPEAHAVEVDPRTAPAYILPTGGTTGAPKAVTLSHRNLVANAWQQYYRAGARIGQERLLSVLPFFHSYGLSTNVMGGAAMIASLYLHHRFQPRQVIRTIEREKITVLHAVPAMLVAINEQLRKRPADLSSLKWVISGGASLSEDVAREFARYSGALIVEGYGLSEASPVTHVGPLFDEPHYGTIGLPLPDTDCRIVDSETGTREVSDGDVGELLVRGPQVMLGYWNMPEATRAVMRDGWLMTGDLARKRPDGLYQIVDRKKDMIITSGFNVYPQEVEDILKQHPDIRDAAVVGSPDPQRGEVVRAFVVMKPGAEFREEAMKVWCREHLSAHKRPRVWEHVTGELPKSFLGKVIRRRLRDQSADSSNSEDPVRSS